MIVNSIVHIYVCVPLVKEEFAELEHEYEMRAAALRACHLERERLQRQQNH
jgi:hypothetical protein